MSESSKNADALERQPILSGKISQPTQGLESTSTSASTDVRQSRLQAISAGVSRIRDAAVAVHTNSRPWSECLDRTQFKKPAGMGEALSRLRKNVPYFGRNYAMVAVGTTALCMVFNPGSIVTLVLLGVMWLFVLLYNGPIRLPGSQREFSAKEQTAFSIAVTFVTVFFFSSVLSTLLYGLVLSSGLVALHGSFRVPEEPLFGDQPPAALGQGVQQPGTSDGGALSGNALQATAVMGALQGVWSSMVSGLGGGAKGEQSAVGPNNV